MGVYITGDNILSPLGFTTKANIEAIRKGTSGIRPCGCSLEIPEPFWASMLDEACWGEYVRSVALFDASYTRFEQLVLLSIWDAVQGNAAVLADPRTLLILSTTKGNIELLDPKIAASSSFEKERLFLWKSAQLIAQFFSNPNEPLVVSNACISGVSAQIVAKRMLDSGAYDRVVVTGADVLSKFVVSGFQSFKALAPEVCRPFDAKRCGLNIGEGAATLVLERNESNIPGRVSLESGAITNDANHISGPSRTGEGLYRALQQVLEGVELSEIGFVNAHGTATLYNDEMESIAFSRAGLLEVPVYSLKGYFGHTLGASGVLETVVAAHALQEGFLPASLGYELCGVSQPLRIITQSEDRVMRQCLKTASGFGGCNATIRLKWKELC